MARKKMMNERSRWIHIFYDVYGKIQKNRTIRMNGRFTNDKNTIWIYEISEGKRTTVCKVEEEDETQCYKSAAKRLIEQQKREMI